MVGIELGIWRRFLKSSLDNLLRLVIQLAQDALMRLNLPAIEGLINTPWPLFWPFHILLQIRKLPLLRRPVRFDIRLVLFFVVLQKPFLLEAGFEVSSMTLLCYVRFREIVEELLLNNYMFDILILQMLRHVKSLVRNIL